MARPRLKLQSRTKLKLEQILRFELMGRSTKQIAGLMSMAVSSIRELMRHPEATRMRASMTERIYGPIDERIRERKASEVLDDAAPDAADALTELLESEDEVTRRLSATAVLDRTGHGPIQRRAVRVRQELEPASIKLLAEAFRDVADVEAYNAATDVEVVTEETGT